LSQRDRIAVVQTVVDLLDDDLECKIAKCYMDGFSDWEIRMTLQITQKALSESRKSIRQKILVAAEQLEEVRLSYELLRTIRHK
jgi:hypothetical protein